MLDLDDPRWAAMHGGYRRPVDVRPLLRTLESGDRSAWEDLWNVLHHQGDVGEASYAAVPHLVRIYVEQDRTDWNVYALVATIELARTRPPNPTLPAWIQADYAEALRQLSDRALRELASAASPYETRGMLAAVALSRGARLYAELLVELTEDEVAEVLGRHKESKPHRV